MQSDLFTPCGHLRVCSNCASLIMRITKMCPICCTPACVYVCVFLSVCLSLWVSVSLVLSTCLRVAVV
jgi:hypothetical protein